MKGSGFRESYWGSTRPRSGFNSRRFLSQSMGSLPNGEQDESTERRFSSQPNETDVLTTKTSRKQTLFSRGESRTQSRENLIQWKAATTFKTTIEGSWRKPNHLTRPHHGGLSSVEFMVFYYI